MRFASLVSLMATVLGFGAVLRADAALPAGVTKVTSADGITEYKLENGLHFLIFPDASKPVTTVNITYLVGSRMEGSGEGGMAHLLEHMVFKGSTKHTNIPQELTQHGARPNGTTGEDRTNYYETFQASDVNLRWALDLESDRMVNSFIKQEDFDKEFSVVRNEFERGEDNPLGVLYGRTMAAAYTAHNYGRPVIGNRSDVEHVPMENLRAFYHKFYQPDNAVLTIAGKVDEAQTVALVNEYFGKIPRPTRVLTPTHTVEPVQDGERMTVVRRVGDMQAVMAGYHTPDGSNADSAVLEVLSGILGEESSGRLYKALVVNKKATQVGADWQRLTEPGMFLAYAQLRKSDSIDDVRKVMLDTIAGVAKEPPSKEEVERAKTRLLKRMELSLSDSNMVGLFLSESIKLGDWRMMFLDRERVKAVTPDDVKRVAAAYFKPSNQTVGEFIPDAKPDRATIPAKTDVAAALKDFKSGEAIEQGEAFDSSPKNVEARTQRFTLAPGMKVALLSKKTRGGSVRAVINLHFGDVDSLQGKDAIGTLTASMLDRGTKDMTRQQIQDALDRLKAEMSIHGDASGATISIQTVHNNLGATLALLGKLLRTPVFPENEFDQLRKADITDLEAAKTEPQAIAPTRLNRALYPYPRGDVRGTPSMEESIEDLEKAKVEDAREFYKAFYGANHGEVGIVGDFDAAEAKKALTAVFEGFSSGAKYERLKNGFQNISAVNETVETPDKANATFVAGLRLKLSDNDARYPALVLGNYMLGGGFLNSRLATRIRVKEGLSYGVSSSVTAKSFEEDGRFMAFAIAAPQNVSRVEAAFKDEVAKAVKDGFTEKEIDEDRTGWLQSRQVQRSDDRMLASILALRDRDDRTLAWDARMEDEVRKLTAASLNAAFSSLIDAEQISVVKAGDFKKAAAAAAAAK